MLTKVDKIVTPDFQKIENAISEVEKICDARISYNTELKRFFEEASLSEVQSFAKGLFKKPVAGAKELSVELKNQLIKEIQDDIDFYEKIKKIISENINFQQTVDELHFQFYIEYAAKRKSEIDENEHLKKSEKGTFFEMYSLRSAIGELECFVSKSGLDFIRDHNFNFCWNPNSDKTDITVDLLLSKKTHLLNKSNHLLTKINNLIEAHILPKQDTYKGLLDELGVELERIVENINLQRDEYLSRGDKTKIWYLYRAFHEAYIDGLESISKLEQHPIFAISSEEKDDYLVLPQPGKAKPKTPQKSKNLKQRRKKKSVPKNKQKPKAKGSVILQADVSEAKVEAVADVVSLPVPQKTEATVDSFALKTQAWKDEVARRRQEKQNTVDKEKQMEREYLEKQKGEKEAYLLHKEEIDYRNAYQLLEKLNSRNLELVEYMFQKPTPHCKIRYQDIEGLFGQESGKLPGAITSVSGSHRKIVIQNTIGFFDEINIADNVDLGNQPLLPMYQDFQQKEVGLEIVGGTFKAHKSGQGGSTLPSIAITLVCSTLERAGITAENIAQYKKEKAEKSKRLSL